MRQTPFRKIRQARLLSLMFVSVVTLGVVSPAEATQCINVKKTFPKVTTLCSMISYLTGTEPVIGLFCVSVNQPDCREKYALLRTPGALVTKIGNIPGFSIGQPVYGYEGSFTGPVQRVW